MEEFKEKLVSADPFKTWWPFIVSILVGLAITIRCCSCVITWISVVSLIPTVLSLITGITRQAKSIWANQTTAVVGSS